MSGSMTIRQEATGDLWPHPMLSRVGMMAGLSEHFGSRAKKAGKNREQHKERAEELSGDWSAFLSSLEKDGIIEPIKICRIPVGDAYHGVKPFYIVDGRNRWTGAKELEFETVPVIEVDPEDAPAIIAATVAGRRHYSKSATAYLACILHPSLALENSAGRKSRTECAISETATLDSLAAKFSVSPRLLDQAAELYRLLSDHSKFQTDAEADVWAGCGLGGVLAGVKSLIATGLRGGNEQSSDAKRAVAAWTYTSKACAQLGSAWERWDDLGTEQRELALERLTETLGAAPDSVKALLKSLE